MFIGRNKELNALNTLYKSDKFEFVVIYGRRRVGKTALINHFINDKKAIYFMGVESNEKLNLENLSRSIIEYQNNITGDFTFASYQAALEYVFQMAKTERLVLVIDEYPYVAKNTQSLASTIQLLIDQNMKDSKLMLILCGSSMSYMEDQVLAYKSPLYGRRTAQIKINPFDFAESCQCFPNMSNEEKAIMYGIVGGTPQYILQMSDKLSIEENIKNTFLNPMSFIYEEPINLLKQEVREPAIYTAIITAIATGYSRMVEISTKVGEDTNVCSRYLKNLISLGIIKKETPYGEKESKKSIYTIEDNMFKFWYRFVLDNTSGIARGAVDIVYKKIEGQLNDYMGKIFENICMQYLWKLLIIGKSPVDFTSLGRWWGNDPINKCQVEIDIMGEQDKNTALLAECKWRNELIDRAVLEKLTERSRLFKYSKVHYFLFSKTGFTQECIQRADEMGNVSLVCFNDMIDCLLG